MKRPTKDQLPQLDVCLPDLKKLADVFRDMDRAYGTAAAAYGFDCQGCEDSCCLTRFYHHTLLEIMYLCQGIQTLAPGLRNAVVERAAQVCRRHRDADQTGDRMRIMCPLNSRGRCLLYDYRPMICRMHGIPHRLRHPAQGVLTGPGCHMFEDMDRGEKDFGFDRTPFYTAVAGLEKALRRKTNLSHKIRLTIADMIMLIQGKTPT